MVEKDKLIAELDERYSKKEGGKIMPGSEEYISKKDWEYQRGLDKLAAEAEKEEVKSQQAIETLGNQLKEALNPNHRKHCVSSNCQISQVHSQIFQNGYDKGRVDTLANLKYEDVPPRWIGNWLKEARRREGK